MLARRRRLDRRPRRACRGPGRRGPADPGARLGAATAARRRRATRRSARRAGRYIAFLDADDLLAAREARACRSATWSAAGAPFTFAAYAGSTRTAGRSARSPVPARVDRARLLRGNVIACQTAAYDAAALGAVEMPDLPRRQDYGLWLTLLARGGAAHGLPEVLADWRVRAGLALGEQAGGRGGDLAGLPRGGGAGAGQGGLVPRPQPRPRRGQAARARRAFSVNIRQAHGYRMIVSRETISWLRPPNGPSRSQDPPQSAPQNRVTSRTLKIKACGRRASFPARKKRRRRSPMARGLTPAAAQATRDEGSLSEPLFQRPIARGNGPHDAAGRRRRNQRSRGVRERLRVDMQHGERRPISPP